MMKNHIQGIGITIIFLLTTFGFFFYYLFGEDMDQSIIENRKLSQRPDLTAENLFTGVYSKRFETYYNDQFPMRESFIEANALVNKNLLRQNVKDDVFIADNGYLLAQIVKQTPKEARTVASRVNSFAANMAKKDVSVYTALMPNKSTMMQDLFPSYFRSYGQENMDLLYRELDDTANPIDSRDAIGENMDEANMFFYTDHHWQAKAAFFAYQNAMSHIIKSEKLNDVIYEYDDYEWELKGKPFYGSDSRKTTSVNVVKADQIVVASLKNSAQPIQMKWGSKLQEGLYEPLFLEMDEQYTNRYQAYLGGDYAQLAIENPNLKNGESVLVIKDSYANAFIQFLVPHYKQTYVLDLRHFKGMSLENYVEKNNIDHIILVNNVNSIYVTPALTNFENPGEGENQ